jgi:hypothetical protein
MIWVGTYFRPNASRKQNDNSLSLEETNMYKNAGNRKFVNRIDAVLAMFLLAVLFLSACSPQTVPQPGTGSETQGNQGGYQGIVDALNENGASVQPAGQIQEPFFGNPALAFTVNGENVQIFEFATVEQREAAAATISGNGFIIGTAMVDWIGTPFFYASERVIVLYVGSNPEMVELLTGILGAPLTGTQP